MKMKAVVNRSCTEAAQIHKQIKLIAFPILLSAFTKRSRANRVYKPSCLKGSLSYTRKYLSN